MATERPAQIFIVSGPSGSGKTTVVEHLVEAVPDLWFSVSYTTRPPRAGEKEGREYRYVGREFFREMIGRGEFLEYAEVYGDFYGTHRSARAEAERHGKDLLLDIDVQGARQVKAQVPEAVAILLLPPSWQELQRRLRGRGLDRPEIMQRRLERAREEIENYDIYDYVVVNRALPEACAQVEAIVVSERNRRAGGAASSITLREAESQAAAARKEANRGQVSVILETFGAQTE